MKRKLFVVWNREENRPALVQQNFGAWCSFSTIEQAQAYFAKYHNTFDYFIKEMEVI